ncbi:MAG TPA: hypothetical protein VK452_07290 [Dissulfurispiraceae bacterium]|nr:hypothetical protein [Dissulfurispiraceae bacterium]
MKKLLALVVAFVFIFSLSTALAVDKAAETKSTPAKAVKKSASKKHQLTGEVKAVDAKAATLTIKGKKDMTFIADENMLKDIKIGDKIIVTYTESEGKATATGIKMAKAPKKVEAKKDEKKDDKKAEPATPPAKDSKPAKKKKDITGC